MRCSWNGRQEHPCNLGVRGKEYPEDCGVQTKLGMQIPFSSIRADLKACGDNKITFRISTRKGLALEDEITGVPIYTPYI